MRKRLAIVVAVALVAAMGKAVDEEALQQSYWDHVASLAKAPENMGAEMLRFTETQATALATSLVAVCGAPQDHTWASSWANYALHADFEVSEAGKPLGSGETYALLGVYAMLGVGQEPSPDDAQRLWRVAVDAERVDVPSRLALLMLAVHETPHSAAQREWLAAAAGALPSRGHTQSQLCRSPTVLESNPPAPIQWYCATLRDVRRRAQRLLGDDIRGQSSVDAADASDAHSMVSPESVIALYRKAAGVDSEGRDTVAPPAHIPGCGAVLPPREVGGSHNASLAASLGGFFDVPSDWGYVHGRVALGECAMYGACAPEAVVDDDLAFTMLETAAARNSTTAAFNLGMWYALQSGEDPLNAHRSIRWLTEAAEAGSMPAAYRLGQAYLRGFGVSRHVGEAAYWLQRAAESEGGHADAAFLLGDLHYAEEEYRAAAKWYTEAGDTHADALNSLGVIHFRGLRHEKDAETAKAYFQKAADLGHVQAMTNMAAACTQDPACDALTALRWYQEAYEREEYAPALVRAGDLLMDGKGGVRKDVEAAAKLFRRAVVVLSDGEYDSLE